MPLIGNIPCVILAGGKSSRMGTNKALLPFGEGHLLSYEYAKMCKIFQNVFISSKQNLSMEFQDITLIEKDEVFSPMVGILNAFLSLKTQKIFFLSVDTPFVKEETFYKLCTQQNLLEGGYDVVYPITMQRCHYLISLWDKNTTKALQSALDSHQYKFQNLLENLRTLPVSFEYEEEFYNLNTPQDYQNITAKFEG